MFFFFFWCEVEEFHPRNYWRQNCDFDFNIGSGTSSDMRELVTNVLRLVQSQSQINLVPGNDEKLLSYTSVSILKAKEILEFSPKVFLYSLLFPPSPSPSPFLCECNVAVFGLHM